MYMHYGGKSCLSMVIDGGLRIDGYFDSQTLAGPHAANGEAIEAICD